MNSFSDYLSNVKAEATLKDNTKTYIRAALADRATPKDCTASVIEFRRKNFTMKKMIIALSSVAACAIFAVGGFAYYNTPVNYVSFDINPSVEFGINAFDRVVCAEAYNEDGTLLLEGNNYTHQTLENAINILIQEAAEQGFLMDDGSTVIAATVETNNEKTATELQKTCEAEINLALSAGERTAVVYTDCVNLQIRTQAREAGVSPGKFRLIEILQTIDSGATIEQYRNARITDIITAAGEMLSGTGAGQHGEYAGALEKIQNAAQQVQAAYGNTQQEQYQNQGTETGTQQQTQNQGSDSARQEQEQNQNSGTTGNEQEQEQNQNQSTAPSSGLDGNGQSGPAAGPSGSDTESGNTAAPSGGGANSSGAQSGRGSGGKN